MHNAFQAIVKTLLLWLVLLALPLQGLAAAVPHCVLPSSAMQGEHAGHGAQHGQQPDTDHPMPVKHGGSHDGCAAACCLGALLPASLGLPPLPANSQPVASQACHMAGIVHAPPKHPPRILPA
jgi:hypothetical protein